MQRQAILLSFTMAVLAGCSAANAAAADPNNDVHCAALAMAFSNSSDLLGASHDQKRAASVIADWYRGKLTQIVKLRPPESVFAEGQQVLMTFRDDMASVADEYLLCVERATKDPGFDKKG